VWKGFGKPVGFYDLQERRRIYEISAKVVIVPTNLSFIAYEMKADPRNGTVSLEYVVKIDCRRGRINEDGAAINRIRIKFMRPRVFAYPPMRISSQDQGFITKTVAEDCSAQSFHREGRGAVAWTT
jgi:hypothetical protein